MMYEAPARKEQMFLAHTLLRPVSRVCLRVLIGSPLHWIWNNIYHCQKEMVKWWNWTTRKEIMLSGSVRIITKLVINNTWKIRIKIPYTEGFSLSTTPKTGSEALLGNDMQSLGEQFLTFWRTSDCIFKARAVHCVRSKQWKPFKQSYPIKPEYSPVSCMKPFCNNTVN